MSVEVVLQPLNHRPHTVFSTDFFEQIMRSLSDHGWCLLRDIDMNLNRFNEVLSRLCSTVTFDPARARAIGQVQKVDAGTAAIGFHIENGNTPTVPELVAFYSHRSARQGSETTVCDGVRMWEAMPQALRSLFADPLTVERRLQPEQWKRYLLDELRRYSDASAHLCVEDMSTELLLSIVEAQDNVEVTPCSDESVICCIRFNPVLRSRLGQRDAFANAILGPSFNYDPPVYRHMNGTVLSTTVVEQLRSLADHYTQQVNWCDGDLLLLDNHRVMHGRREILDASRREIFIGMGELS